MKSKLLLAAGLLLVALLYRVMVVSSITWEDEE